MGPARLVDRVSLVSLEARVFLQDFEARVAPDTFALGRRIFYRPFALET